MTNLDRAQSGRFSYRDHKPVKFGAEAALQDPQLAEGSPGTLERFSVPKKYGLMGKI